ncbi:MAG TPA: CcmD family protein [Methanosarcinaceae archaeon]|nr:CcmD family protein [Methanosarcinaceae archaeon]
MDSLYTAFTIAWIAIFSYIFYMIRTRLQLNRELAKLDRLL